MPKTLIEQGLTGRLGWQVFKVGNALIATAMPKRFSLNSEVIEKKRVKILKDAQSQALRYNIKEEKL